MIATRITILASALALAGCAAGANEPAPDAEALTRNVPAARVTGEPQSCIRLVEVTNSEVRNDYTIDFERGPGDDIYRAVLDNGCPGLSSADAFTYDTSLSQLCTTDIIYPLHQGGGLNRGPGCGISRFIPMELAP